MNQILEKKKNEGDNDSDSDGEIFERESHAKLLALPAQTSSQEPGTKRLLLVPAEIIVWQAMRNMEFPRLKCRPCRRTAQMDRECTLFNDTSDGWPLQKDGICRLPLFR